MKNSTLIILISVILFSSCGNIKFNSIIKVNRPLKQVYQATESALNKFKSFKNHPMYHGVQTISVSNYSELKIFSESEKMRSILENSILQEIYMMESNQIPANILAKKKEVGAFLLLNLLNAGSGFYYAMDDNLDPYFDLPAFKYIETIGMGSIDLLGLGMAGYGLLDHKDNLVLAGLFLSGFIKAVNLLSILPVLRHNMVFETGYNFDKDFNVQLKFKIPITIN